MYYSPPLIINRTKANIRCLFVTGATCVLARGEKVIHVFFFEADTLRQFEFHNAARDRKQTVSGMTFCDGK